MVKIGIKLLDDNNNILCSYGETAGEIRNYFRRKDSIRIDLSDEKEEDFTEKLRLILSVPEHGEDCRFLIEDGRELDGEIVLGSTFFAYTTKSIGNLTRVYITDVGGDIEHEGYYSSAVGGFLFSGDVLAGGTSRYISLRYADLGGSRLFFSTGIELRNIRVHVKEGDREYFLCIFTESDEV